MSTMHCSVEQQMHGSHGRLISSFESYMIAYVRFLPPSLTKHCVQMHEAGANGMNWALAYAVGFSSGWMYTDVEWMVSSAMVLNGIEGDDERRRWNFGIGAVTNRLHEGMKTAQRTRRKARNL